MYIVYGMQYRVHTLLYNVYVMEHRIYSIWPEPQWPQPVAMAMSMYIVWYRIWNIFHIVCSIEYIECNTDGKVYSIRQSRQYSFQNIECTV